ESMRWGGSCPNVACKPTKAYVVVADLAHDVNSVAGKLGIEVGEATVNLARVKARKDELITPRHVWIERLRSAGHERFDGTGAFLDPTTVQVNGGRISAQRILAATGSHPGSRGRGEDLRPTDPRRPRLAHGRSADRGPRRGRLDRPRDCAGTNGAARLPARGGRRARRAGARSDLLALRLPRPHRAARRPDRAALRYDRDGGAARRTRGGGNRDPHGDDDLRCLPGGRRHRRNL